MNLKKLIMTGLVAVATTLMVQTGYADDILIENITLLDGTGKAARPHSYVLIENNRIARISSVPLEVDKKAQKIDGTGKYLLPGLFDVHIHLKGGVTVDTQGLKKSTEPDFRKGIQALQSYLYSGVTSIYDAGNDPEYILKLRADERTGKITSPRIFATGAIVTYPGSHGSGFADIDRWPEGKTVLDKHIATKPDMLKLTLEERGWGSRPMIPKLPLDLLQHIVEYYNDHGIRTTIHTSSELRARQAIFAGIDTLAHPVIQGPITDEFAALMGTKKIPMATTLTIGENYSRLAEHPEFLDQPLYKSVFSDKEIEKLKTETSKEYAERKWTWWMKIMTDIAQENLAKINKAGGVLAVGTDQSNGPAVHRELELLDGAGIPRADIIRIATLNSAIFLGKEKELGSIEEGKLADLLIVTANPLDDINNLKKIDTVLKGGIVIDRSKLDLPVNHQ